MFFAQLVLNSPYALHCAVPLHPPPQKKLALTLMGSNSVRGSLDQLDTPP